MDYPKDKEKNMARLKGSIGTPTHIEKVKKVVISEDTKMLVAAWNGLSKKKTCKMKQNTLEIIQRNISKGNLKAMLIAIGNYKTILADESYFFDYQWSLQDFTLYKTYTKFLDDGPLWVTYTTRKGKATAPKAEAAALPVVDVPGYKEVLKYLSAMDYKDYLHTDHWRHFTQEARKHYGNKCALCDSKETLHIHHKTYANRGRETFNDVICLCHKCHALAHNKNA